MSKESTPEGLELLRKPFAKHQIGKLPKPTKAQTADVKADYRKGIKCDLCGGWHHPKVVHLDYVGHAALTDRLLDVDPGWSWEPLALTGDGLPKFDDNGGLWITLTVLGMKRLGYGAADGKEGNDAIKEIIGDALRNAAMRFGAGLDLWHKGDLHIDAEAETETLPPQKPPVDLAKIQTPEGREYIAGWKTAREAIEQISKSKHVDETAEALINDLWIAEND